MGGFLLYALGARASIPVAAVLSSLTGAMGVGWGRLAFAERLRPLQLAGVVVIFGGVAVISATTAEERNLSLALLTSEFHSA